MKIATDSATAEIIRIKSTLIQFVREAGILRTIIAHQPMGGNKASLDQILDEIESHCSDNAVIQEMPSKLNGRVHVMEWKVIHE